MNKCFICGKKYNPKKVKPINFHDKYDKHLVYDDINKIQYKDKKIPLCNQCFRICMFAYCLNNNYDMIIEE